LAKSFYGIIGWPLTQTFSPGYFNQKFADLGIDAVYGKFPIEHIEAFPTLLQSQPALRGLNVTIPHKTAVIPYMDALSDDARAMGAVNCIDIRSGKLTGHNTDWYGFLHSLQPLLQPHHLQALILGTGGAAKAIIYALDQLGIRHQLVSRTAQAGRLTYEALNEEVMAQYSLIINTTPLGMIPNEHKAPPIPYHLLSAGHLLYDIVYTEAYTPFLQLGADKGAAVKNGLEMLHLQAEGSWQIWNR
jgi:shikimate dehydrogenase